MAAFTLVHVVISLVGIVSGIIVLGGLIAGKRLDGWTMLFLATTVATSVTGFFFPFERWTPGDTLGVISLVVLAAAIGARYVFRLAGSWRVVYVVSAVTALYLNVFVLVVQLFEKVPALHSLAPTQSEPPFLATELVVLALFIALGVLAVRGFRLRPLITN